MRTVLLVLTVLGGPAYAATDYIAPGTPSTIGRSGSVLGSAPGAPVPAPRGSMSTFGLPEASPKPSASPAPSRGANSFSLNEAKQRIEAGGFKDVSGLAKDNNGVWRGRAIKAGQPITVYCDFQGNVGTL